MCLRVKNILCPEKSKEFVMTGRIPRNSMGNTTFIFFFFMITLSIIFGQNLKVSNMNFVTSRNHFSILQSEFIYISTSDSRLSKTDLSLD